MKKLSTLFLVMLLFVVAGFAQPWDVELTIIDPGNGHADVMVKSEVDTWTGHAMVSDMNPNPTTWTYTYSVSAAGSYEWGAFAKNISWLLNEPYGTHTGNLLFTVDASGNITGETSFTLNEVDLSTETMSFYLDMNSLINQGTYEVGDYVEVRGSFNAWISDIDFQLNDSDGDGIYSLTTEISYVPNEALAFKFVHGTLGENWEDIDDRSYTVVSGENKYCAVFGLAGSDCAGISVENVNSKNLTVSPNPSTGIFNLSQKASYEVMDLTGKIIARGNAQTIDLRNSNSGMYILKMDANDKISTQKIIVK